MKGFHRPCSRVRSSWFAFLLATALSAPSSFAGTPIVPCDGGVIDLRDGSDFDYGWTGLSHNDPFDTGAGFGFSVVRRCTDDQSVCASDADCSNQQCAATCNCADDSTCEIAGPVGPRHCVTTLADCATNADCPPSDECASMFGPPMPISDAGTPACIVRPFAAAVTGTADFAAGAIDLATELRWRVMLGIAVDQPCPRCGAPGENPGIGDEFTCEGGQFPGADCRVDGVSEEFGGVSFDCPPTLGSNVTGAGLAIRLTELTTSTTSHTAALPCKFFGFAGNPLNPESNPKCLDQRGAEDPVCTSNADCRRCTGDSTIACTGDSDCTGSGTCAEAPDQPISCGFWCNCGFCDGNASLPCLDSTQCPEGQACEMGTGTSTQPNAPQERPNDCSDDFFVCGQDETEICATSVIGTCSGDPFLPCTEDAGCEASEAGICQTGPKPCFGNRITRTGAPSPLGSYCAFAATECTSNVDCAGEGDFCVADSAAPRLASLFCSGAHSSAAINAVRGLTGPAALSLETSLRICRCGDEDPACAELCDELFPCEGSEDGTPCSDGLFCNGDDTCQSGTCSAHTGDPCSDAGDGDDNCSESCNEVADDCAAADPDGGDCDDGYVCTIDDECAAGSCVGSVAPECVTTTTTPPASVCGDWTGDGEITSSDALGVLQAAVGIHECALAICDFDGNGVLTSTDALGVLRAAVELPAEPACPAAA